MTVFIIRRLFQSSIVLLAMTVVVFFGVFAIGDPIEILLPADSTQQQIEAAIQALGLDKPLWTQYWIFLSNALQGDLGNSFVFNQPSISLIFDRLPATLELALSALVIALILGVPLGMIAGMRPNTAFDKAVVTGSILGFSLPNFWQGLMLIMVFSVFLGWLPSTGRGEVGQILGITTSFATLDGIAHLVLPAINLSLFKLALVIRLTRAGMRETLPLDYVKFARAKGLSNRRVIFVHVLKNIMIPVVTVVGMEFGSLIAFAIVTETIFAWPGMGKLIIDSINQLDRPVIVAYLMIVVMIFILINLIVDIVYSLLDPRVRLGEGKS